MLRAPSTDGVAVAIHELAGRAGHPVVLLAHATGFHGHAYLPMAARLAPAFHVYALDIRGHGDTPLPAGWPLAWEGFGDDALAAAQTVAALPGSGGGMVGFGHSMGGASLLMAAARQPELFRLLVLFEPIVNPGTWSGEGPPSPLIEGARRRRAEFDSFDAAIANFASKPPLDAFDPDALDAYVRHGFRQNGDHVRLKCDPETEATAFERGGLHHTWDLLPGIDVPTVVVAGRSEDTRPSEIAPRIAERLPHGRFVREETMDHFGPMTHPADVARLIAREAAAV